MKTSLFAADTIGDGVTQACRSATKMGRSAGSVVGTFSSGFYVRVAETLFAVGGQRKISPGPIHLTLKTLPRFPPEQSVVHFEPARLLIKTGIIDLTSAARYQPAQPLPARLRRIVPVLAKLYTPDAVPQDIAHVWSSTEDAIRRCDLNEAQKLLQGLGGGLTPTGDDVLAGLLLFSHWADPGSNEPADIARQAATTNLSRCFLNWAAIGQSIQPVHDLLWAAEPIKSGASPTSSMMAQAKWATAVNRVASIGHSSGRAILVGLGLAASMHGSRKEAKLASAGFKTFA